MAELGVTRTASASHNIYTVLLGIAFVALLLGVALVWFWYSVRFDEVNPFAISQAVDLVRPFVQTT